MGETQVEVIVRDGVPLALMHDCYALCGDGVRRMLLRRSIKLDTRWKVTGPDNAATLDPSLACAACDLHGYWRDGKWVGV